jgi:hypothetical protein
MGLATEAIRPLCLRIVNIPERQIEVYTQPSGPTENPEYAQLQIYKEGDSVPVVIDGKEIGLIAVKDVLP